jgi:hypothetical protein
MKLFNLKIKSCLSLKVRLTTKLQMRFFKKKPRESEKNFDDFPPIGGLMVSKMVVDKNIRPGFMYREKRTRPEDSGWRIFTGLESEEYTDDPKNTGIYNPSTILKIDPSIENILLKGVGSVYERAGDSSEWYKVTDFELEGDYIAKHSLAAEWTIEINNLFERSVKENGDLFYTTGDKSVRLSIWHEEGEYRSSLYVKYTQEVNNRDQTLAKTIKTFDFSDAQIARVGYLIRESDSNKSYSVIYAFSIVDNQLVYAAFYFDDEEDLKWAIETWESIKFITK